METSHPAQRWTPISKEEAEKLTPKRKHGRVHPGTLEPNGKYVYLEVAGFQVSIKPNSVHLLQADKEAGLEGLFGTIIPLPRPKWSEQEEVLVSAVFVRALKEEYKRRLEEEPRLPGL